MAAILRTQPVIVEGLNYVYPAPADYDNADTSDRSEASLTLWAKAPWFHREAVMHGGACDRYTNANGVLPGGIPISALDTVAWQRQFCYNDEDLAPKGEREVDGLRRDFVAAALSGLDRLWTYTPVPANLNMDMFVYRTEGEVDYVARLSALSPTLIESWRGLVDVDDRAYCYTKPQLVVDFRFKRKNTKYWTNWVRNERRALEATGLLVPYQSQTQHCVKSTVKAVAYPRATVGVSRIEPPLGCNTEMPSVVSYKGSALIDPRSGYWMVFYTEKAAKTAAFIMLDAYDNYRLWNVSQRMIGFLRKLNLVPILGNQVNVDEFYYMLDLVEQTNFRRLPRHWRSNAKRRGAARYVFADFMYYDPYSRDCITESEYRTLRNQPRPIRPAGYPTGFDFTQEIPGWEETLAQADLGVNDYDYDEDMSESCDSYDRWDAPGYGRNDGGGRNNNYYDNGGGRNNNYHDNGGGRYGDRGDNGNQGAGSSTDATRLHHVREFLRDCGVPEDHLVGTLPELRGYLRGRLNYR